MHFCVNYCVYFYFQNFELTINIYDSLGKILFMYQA